MPEVSDDNSPTDESPETRTDESPETRTDESPKEEIPASRIEDLYPLFAGLILFALGNWMWIRSAVDLRHVPSFLWVFTIAFVGTSGMRMTANSRTDYLVILTPVLALLGTMASIYFIRMGLIRDQYAYLGLPVPDWWHDAEIRRKILTAGETTRGIMELATLLMASVAGMTSSAALIPKRKDQGNK